MVPEPVEVAACSEVGDDEDHVVLHDPVHILVRGGVRGAHLVLVLAILIPSDFVARELTAIIVVIELDVELSVGVNSLAWAEEITILG